MKIYNKTYKTILFFMFFSVFFSCIKDDNFATPTVECNEPDIVANSTIQQVKDMYTFGGATVIDTNVIIEGYVVSSDKSGNIYKSISIQDKPENPTAAIKISINENDLYTKYNVGRKIYINLNGLAVGYSFGSIQIGQAVGTELGRISAFEISKHIFRSCEVATIIPKKVAISDLNDSMLEMLIEIENVQFKEDELGLSYANADNTQTVNRVLQSFDANCNLQGEIMIRNSGFSDFKNQILPEGKGNVIAIFSNYYSDFQLYLRDTDDVQLTDARCNYTATLTPTITLSEVKDLYQGSVVEFGINHNYITEGYVVSSDENGNFENILIIQDKVENPTTGIQILMDNNAIYQQYNVGDKVMVKLDKLYMDKVNGALAIGYPKNNSITKITAGDEVDFIFNANENQAIVPTSILISDIFNPVYQNTLVTVDNVQLVDNELGKAFTYFSGNNDAVRTLETCGETNKLSVFTNGNASFATTQFPKGHGKITGVLRTNLEIRNTEDVQFTNPYEVCPVIIPKILITEVADPKNSVSSRFVELYNAGTSAINLTGWKLNKYLNGSTTVSGSPVDLSGIVIAAGDFVIIANTGYAAKFNDTPNIETTYISGNGDDSYALVDNTGAVEDIFGVIGEDGTGTDWEYLDGRAVRNLAITEPNPVFTASEWTIYSDANNANITNPNSPQNAPTDFNPRVR
ncbi:DUF5689 domain-containing protein [Lutibacter sp.]|uniref:DUF5689 domain-containing protein n=1 Tax=Lutibacter sp. TaxID=1925666 RepID=UPI0025C53666|nr:DUF5689 domain-containing protein [Lutibacter sp.]MCF6182759.1 DUF5689 domain-containing protein [Lutibacter sp.]